MTAGELLAAYLGGAVCYAGVLLTPAARRGGEGRLAWVLLLSLLWPASIALAHEWSASRGGRS